MGETGHFLKAMHEEGVVPNDYIFSKILHGYVKCGYVVICIYLNLQSCWFMFSMLNKQKCLLRRASNCV